MDLSQIKTESLVKELESREYVRSMKIYREEVHRVQAVGLDDSKNRYIKGEGPAVILEIRKSK